MTRIAVVGHTEWIEFVAVPRQAGPGGLQEGRLLQEHAGSSAVVAAVVLTRLGAEVDFYTALGDDERARRAEAELVGYGITVHAARRDAETRHLFTTITPDGERAIVTVGQRLAPRIDDGLELGPLRSADGVYASACDAGLLEVAAGSGALLVTTRIGAPRTFAGVSGISAAVFSAADDGETRELEGWTQLADVLVATEGARGGHWYEGSGRPENRGRWGPAPVPGAPQDSFGCGDAFAGGLAYGLALGGTMAQATASGARAGAEMLTHRGAP